MTKTKQELEKLKTEYETPVTELKDEIIGNVSGGISPADARFKVDDIAFYEDELYEMYIKIDDVNILDEEIKYLYSYINRNKNTGDITKGTGSYSEFFLRNYTLCTSVPEYVKF